MATFFRWRPHPWHGLSVGPDAPSIVHAYIEMTPFDSVKYEIDKQTGYLRVDRPQRYSSQPPALYGFIPQTYCGERIKKLSPKSECGDGDPIDIVVFCERPIDRAEVLLNARVVGGIRMVDGGEADDKIIAVLENDPVYASIQDITDIPEPLIERLRHYFLTYKLKPGHTSTIELDGMYGAQEAQRVIQASMEDYKDHLAKLSAM